ncbi:MAG: Zn-dependent hydrolase [Burkholderiaceae bacterium]|nr:Zn-dependent hydrolase [Burkholderiaceae bacterium]
MGEHAADDRIDGARLWTDLMRLGEITEPDLPYTRRSFSTKFLEGREWLAGRFRDAGLAVRIDEGGNLIGRRAGCSPDAATIMLGSHSDSVPGGGRFDGIAGVLAGLEVARALRDAGVALEHALEVVDFLAEEPSEFGLSCIGSRAMAGALEEDQLEQQRPGGEKLREAMRRVGGAPERLGAACRDDVLAFLELHIEQGPVLEARGLDVGIVTAIVGITRLELHLVGEAAHAGTAPMSGRRDAAVAAAEIVVAIRDLARACDACGEGYFVATAGVIDVRPNAVNVVPGEARLVIDARCESASLMKRFIDELHSRAAGIAAASAIELAGFRVLSDNDPAGCDPDLQQILLESAAALGRSAMSMASGAGHDAAFVSRVAPAAMIFVPCLGGRSHCPQEWSEPSQLAAGTEVMLEAVLRIDRGVRSVNGSGR